METSGPLSDSRDRDVTIVLFGPELKQIDELNVAAVGQRLLEISDELPSPLLVLDMSPVEFFGSSFIEVLFRVWKTINLQPGAHLALSGMQPYCREVLKVTHLDSLWEIYDTSQAASDAFNSPRSQ